MLLVALILTFSQIQDTYYSDSQNVSQIQIESLSLEGDSLYWVTNWVIRANYKQANFERAYELFQTIPLDSVEYEALYFDLLSLEPLLLKNIGEYDKANFKYIYAISKVTEKYPAILYRLHLNYAELLRLTLDYNGRMKHLNEARRYATGTERDKVIRNIARQYINIEHDFEKARDILSLHSTPIGGESISGWHMVQGELLKEERLYIEASEEFKKAHSAAQEAGFISFMEDASDGYASSMIGYENQVIQHRINMMYQIIGLVLIASLSIGAYIINQKTEKERNGNNF